MKGEYKYAKDFFDHLRKHISTDVASNLDCDEVGNIVKSERNSQLFAKALHDTCCDMNDIAGMMGMAAACEYGLIGYPRMKVA